MHNQHYVHSQFTSNTFEGSNLPQSLNHFFMNLVFSIQHPQCADPKVILQNLQYLLAGQLPQVQVTLHEHRQTIFTFLWQCLCSNINLLQTLSCLNNCHWLLHKHQRNLVRNQLVRRYPPNLFLSQFKKLQSIDQNMLSSFIELVSTVCQWFRMQLQQRDYHLPEQLQLEYVYCYLQFTSTLAWQHDLALQQTKFVPFLVVATHLLESCYCPRLVELLPTVFYGCFSAIDVFEDCDSIINSCLYNILKLHSEQQTMRLYLSVCKLMFKQITLAIIKNISEPQKQFGKACHLISNILCLHASRWNGDSVIYWLGQLRNVADLLDIPIEKQKDSIINLQLLHTECLRNEKHINISR